MDPPNPKIRGHQSRAVSGSANIPGNLTINDIPDEILLYIIKWVPIYHKSDLSIVSYGQLSLRNLALCSRRFHQLVEPILYERLYHNRHTPQNGIVVFLARPDLAKRVKAIHTTVTYGKLPSRGPFEMTSSIMTTGRGSGVGLPRHAIYERIVTTGWRGLSWDFGSPLLP